MPSDSRKKFVSAVQIVLAVGAASGFYVYGTPRNRGAVPGWFENAFSLLWVIGVLALIVFSARRSENRLVRNLSKERVALRPGEQILFSNSFMSAQFFQIAMPLKLELTFREWLKGGRVRVIGLLSVRLTSSRLIFGLLIGRTWRIVDLEQITNIRDLSEGWPYKEGLLIEYNVDDGVEKILFWTASGRGKRFKEAVHKAVSG